MNILTSDPRSKSQLAILLRELGQSSVFHSSVDSLKDSIRTANGKSIEGVLMVDLSEDVDHAVLVADLKEHYQGRLIGLQFFSSTKDAAINLNAKHYHSSLVLPEHAERAKSRLKYVLTSRSSGAAQLGSLGRRRTNPQRAFADRFKTKPLFPPNGKASKEPMALRGGARYLVCRSNVAKDLLLNLQNLARTDKLAHLLIGEDGAEFELVCRESNFQSIRDRSALHMFAPDDLTFSALEKLEREASRVRTPFHVFVGRTDEYKAENLNELVRFLEFLRDIRRPHLSIYLAHARGSEELFRAGVAEVFETLCAKMDVMKLPQLKDRPEDIPEICHTVIGSLRAVHPFLVAHRISNKAIHYLVEMRAEMTYQQLTRILRNSIALSRKGVLCIEDIKNFGESDLTTQHLLESMADEQFFPADQAANF